MVEEKDIREIKVTREHTDEADKRIEKVMGFNHRIKKASVSPYDMAFSGLLGEIVAAKEVGVPLADDSNFDFYYKGKKVDVKTGIVRSKPKSYFSCQVFSYNKQKTDYYLFMFINRDNFTPVWACGIISSKDFYKEAKFYPAGVPLENGHTMQKDCWIVKVGNKLIRPIEEIGMVVK